MPDKEEVIAPCGAHEERLNNHDKLFEANREDHIDFRKALEKLRDRLPIWATALLSLMSGVIAWMASSLT